MLAAEQREVQFMPTGPKSQKRKANVIGNAMHVMRIATGELNDDKSDYGKGGAAAPYL
jgi:hypothetical protein